MQRVCDRACPETVRWQDVVAGAYEYCDHAGGGQPLPAWSAPLLTGNNPARRKIEADAVERARRG